MTYGLSPRAFIENGPAVQALEARAANTTAPSTRPTTPTRFALPSDATKGMSHGR